MALALALAFLVGGSNLLLVQAGGNYTLNVGSCLELLEQDSNDGTIASAGDTCGTIGYGIESYVAAVNTLNGGRGFKVEAGNSDDPIYFRLNLTLATFDYGTYWNESLAVIDTCRSVFQNVSFILGQGAGCTDAVTLHQANIARNLSTIYMTQRGPSAFFTQHGSNEYFFSSHLDSDRYAYLGLTQCALAGAETIAIVYEDKTNYFIRGVGEAAITIAEDAGLSVSDSGSGTFVTDDLADLHSLLDNAVDSGADILLLSVSNTYFQPALDYLKSLRQRHTFDALWVPQVPWGSGTCAGALEKCSYSIGATQISMDQALGQTDDVFDGMQYSEFIRVHNGSNNIENTDVYAGISAWIQSIQNVFQFRSIDDPETFLQDTTSSDYDYLVEYMRQGRYIGETFHGPIKFNSNGQNTGRDPTTYQSGADGMGEVVFPTEYATAASFDYPAPVGDECPSSYTTEFDDCLLCARTCLPDEDFNYIDDAMIGMGVFFLVTNYTLALIAIAWTVVNHTHPVVKKSQPVFLVLVGLGCITSTSTIIPMMIDDNNFSSQAADTACMTFPWLYTLGFALTFSSLYTKVLRVKRIFDDMCKRKHSNLRTDIRKYVGGGVMIQAVIMTFFTVISPLKFVRSCNKFDEYGLCTDSTGGCANPDNSLYKKLFIPATAIVHFVFLLYAVVLCYQTRAVPTEYAEGRWISMSIFSNIEVLMLGAPLVALVSGADASVSFLVRASIIWLNDGGVLLLIFGPKLYAMYYGSAAVTPIGNPSPSTTKESVQSTQAVLTTSNGRTLTQDDADRALSDLLNKNADLHRTVDELRVRLSQAELASKGAELGTGPSAAATESDEVPQGDEEAEA